MLHGYHAGGVCKHYERLIRWFTVALLLRAFDFSKRVAFRILIYGKDSKELSEESLRDADDIARIYFGGLIGGERLLLSGSIAADIYSTLISSEGVAAGKSDRVKHAHTVNVCIFTRLVDFADD